MIFDEIIKGLQAEGTEQNRKTYARHGVRGEQFGVSFASLGKMAKRIKQNHSAALQLWASGNHDARMLAARVADPLRLDAALVDTWAANLDNYILTDAFSELISRSPLARQAAEAWRGQAEEWISAAGWNITARLTLDAQLEEAYFEGILQDIEKKIHSAKNRARYSMNNALIAIGIRSSHLQECSIQAARRIGKVEVDHGETGCKTPDAEMYILKTAAHRAKRKQKA